MILAIDTATKWLGLAVHNGRSLLAELGWQSNNTQTVDLAPAIDDLLRRLQLEITDLKGIGVAIGPGSYTGLRVGLSVAKGLSLGYQTPLIGINTLDILAAGFVPAAGVGPADAQLCAVAEAGRTRICAALYGWHKRLGWQAKAEPVICTWDELLAQLELPITFAGEISPEAGKQIRAANSAFRIASPASTIRRAGHLAELAWLRLRKGETDDASLLQPNYLRDPAGS